MDEMNNESIVKFLGWKTKEIFTMTGSEIYYIRPENYILDDPRETFVSSDSLKFHKSWDWLMPVIDKIELQHIFNDCIIYYGSYKGVWYAGFRSIYKSSFEEREYFIKEQDGLNSKLEACYQAVVEFVKRYNNGI